MHITPLQVTAVCFHAKGQISSGADTLCRFGWKAPNYSHCWEWDVLLCFRLDGVNSIVHKIRSALLKKAMYYRVACSNKNDTGRESFHFSLFFPLLEQCLRFGFLRKGIVLHFIQVIKELRRSLEGKSCSNWTTPDFSRLQLLTFQKKLEQVWN